MNLKENKLNLLVLLIFLLFFIFLGSRFLLERASRDPVGFVIIIITFFLLRFIILKALIFFKEKGYLQSSGILTKIYIYLKVDFFQEFLNDNELINKFFFYLSIKTINIVMKINSSILFSLLYFLQTTFLAFFIYEFFFVNNLLKSLYIMSFLAFLRVLLSLIFYIVFYKSGEMVSDSFVINFPGLSNDAIAEFLNTSFLKQGFFQIPDIYIDLKERKILICLWEALLETNSLWLRDGYFNNFKSHYDFHNKNLYKLNVSVFSICLVAFLTKSVFLTLFSGSLIFLLLKKDISFSYNEYDFENAEANLKSHFRLLPEWLINIRQFLLDDNTFLKENLLVKTFQLKPVSIYSGRNLKNRLMAFCVQANKNIEMSNISLEKKIELIKGVFSILNENLSNFYANIEPKTLDLEQEKKLIGSVDVIQKWFETSYFQDKERYYKENPNIY